MISKFRFNRDVRVVQHECIDKPHYTVQIRVLHFFWKVVESHSFQYEATQRGELWYGWRNKREKKTVVQVWTEKQ